MEAERWFLRSCLHGSVVEDLHVPAQRALHASMPHDVLCGSRRCGALYQRGLERWIADLLQPVFDSLVSDGMVPPLRAGWTFA